MEKHDFKKIFWFPEILKKIDFFTSIPVSMKIQKIEKNFFFIFKKIFYKNVARSLNNNFCEDSFFWKEEKTWFLFEKSVF